MPTTVLDRYDVITRLICAELNGTEAAQLLRLSTRQVRRLKGKVKKHGAVGLIHGNQGTPSNHRMPRQDRDKIVSLIHRHYIDFKPTFLTEKLKERHHIIRDPETIRQLMITEGLWIPRRLRGTGTHRAWRSRKACYGELVQFDGSYHDWFEGRGLPCCLLAAIDDASGRLIKASFGLHEGVIPVFTFWKAYLRTHGRPQAIYLDKFSTYKMNPGVAQENHDLRTQFERAMQELGIELITAHSPEAKGRVERLFGTLQDRLIKELRLAGINSIPEANTFLEEKFIPQFNERFAVEPAGTANLHRPLTSLHRTHLDTIFARQALRTVQNDFTVSFKNCWYQLTERQPVTVCRRDTVTIEERLDGSVRIRLRGKYLTYQLLPERPRKAHQQPWVLTTTVPKRTAWKPPVDHPWRQQAVLSALKSRVT